MISVGVRFCGKFEMAIRIYMYKHDAFVYVPPFFLYLLDSGSADLFVFPKRKVYVSLVILVCFARRVRK